MTYTRLNPTIGSQLHVEYVQGTFSAGEYAAYITAPSVTGYTFAFWIGAATTGWVGDIYIGEYSASTTRVWTTRIISENNAPKHIGSAVNFRAYALYTKN